MDPITIQLAADSDKDTWDSYVQNHPHGILYHLYGWRNVIQKTYGHRTYYLMAYKDSPGCATNNSRKATDAAHRAVGILPLVHMKHFLFGNSLISIPFFDMGGILANNEEVENALLSEAINLGQKLKVSTIELRHTSLQASQPPSFPAAADFSIRCFTRSHKVRMLLELPESSETLMKSFKSKLRSQIKKPIKEGLKARVGDKELLKDFYHVFSINMRELGSPVHSKKLMENVLAEFPEKTKIVTVYKQSEPVACSFITGFKDILENPWASALRNYSRLAPNMLLYWTMLEYACDNGYRYFDFGRSTPDEGTYKFKEQWGSKPTPLHWHYVSLDGGQIETAGTEKSRFDKAIRYWQRLPVPITKVFGPMIRKHISL